MSIVARLLTRGAEPTKTEPLVISSKLIWPVAVWPALLKEAASELLPNGMEDAPFSVSVSENPCPLPLPEFCPVMV